MRARTGPVLFYLQDELEADLSTICPHGEVEFLRACRLRQDSQIFTYPQLWVNPIVEYCAFPNSPAALSCSNPAYLQFPASLLPQ